jgi:hypothetical protein
LLRVQGEVKRYFGNRFRKTCARLQALSMEYTHIRIVSKSYWLVSESLPALCHTFYPRCQRPLAAMSRYQAPSAAGVSQNDIPLCSPILLMPLRAPAEGFAAGKAACLFALPFMPISPGRIVLLYWCIKFTLFETMWYICPHELFKAEHPVFTK